MIKKRKKQLLCLALSLCLSFIMCGLLMGCNDTNGQKEEAKQMADQAITYCFHGSKSIGDLWRIMGLYESTDKFGNAIPKIDMDEEKTELIKELVEAYNHEATPMFQISEEEGISAFGEDLILCISKGENDKQFKFLDWTISDATVVDRTGSLKERGFSNMNYVKYRVEENGFYSIYAYPWETEKIASWDE